jgi:hypothetical protein
MTASLVAITPIFGRHALAANGKLTEAVELDAGYRLIVVNIDRSGAA